MATPLPPAAGERTTAPLPGRGERRRHERWACDQAGAPRSAATCLASADLRFAAWFLWITPLLTALSSFLLASRSAVSAASLSPEEMAVRTCRTCVLSSDL